MYKPPVRTFDLPTSQTSPLPKDYRECPIAPTNISTAAAAVQVALSSALMPISNGSNLTSSRVVLPAGVTSILAFDMVFGVIYDTSTSASEEKPACRAYPPPPQGLSIFAQVASPCDVSVELMGFLDLELLFL